MMLLVAISLIVFVFTAYLEGRRKWLDDEQLPTREYGMLYCGHRDCFREIRHRLTEDSRSSLVIEQHAPNCLVARVERGAFR